MVVRKREEKWLLGKNKKMVDRKHEETWLLGNMKKSGWWEK